MTITHCPACQCAIVKTGSHEDYTDCLEALITELMYVIKRIIAVMRLEIVKRKQLESELNKVYQIE